jgi:flagellar biosynthetic protein FliR
MLDQITTATTFAYMLVFCRIGAGFMMLPSISEAYISPMARLVAALGVTGLIVPLLQHTIPAMPSSGFALILMFAGEVVIGILLGTVAKIILSAMHVTGSVISYQIGLASATMFDPTQGTQSGTIETFLSILALMLILATDLHHVFIKGLVDSYTIFVPNSSLALNSMAELIGKTVSDSFALGVKLAAPQIVVGLIVNLGAGIMGRLMPQMQVFFIIIPVQILLGLFILMITLSGMMLWFMDYYSSTMANF